VGLVGPVAGLLVGLTSTRSVADAANEVAPAADAFAVIRTCSPRAALALTLTATSSSSAWPTGRLPTVQVAPRAAGQTVNSGAPTCCAGATTAVTEAPVLAAFVLHSQKTKVAF
jgi:hypothetical protein